MADLFACSGIFDELEFLRFSDEQFASEVVLPGACDSQQMSLFSGTVLEPAEPELGGIGGSPVSRTLTELKTAVASRTVGIYNSTESSVFDESVVDQEKTLNEIMVESDRDALSKELILFETGSEDADVTSPVSFSAISEMPLEEESPEVIQSSEVSQTAPPMAAVLSVSGQPVRRKLKVCHKPGALQSPQVRTYGRRAGAETGRQAVKRKPSVTLEEAAELSRFKTSKRTKKYLQKPYGDPGMEKTRLNAINAKKNRDRKKQELKMLSEQCDNLSEENKELDRSNRSLEARLQVAEEEIAFLRRALLGRLGSARPALGDALKSISGGDSAPAG